VIGVTELDDAGGIHHRVLGECGSVQEMEDGFSINGRESASAISFHHLLHRVHPIPLTHVALLTLAITTLSTLTIEYWHHCVPFFHLTHPFPHTLHNPTQIQSTSSIFDASLCFQSKIHYFIHIIKLKKNH